MPYVTLSIDEETLDAAIAYANEQGLSLYELVRRLLRSTIAKSHVEQLSEVFARVNKLGCKSTRRWSREELHER